MVEFMAKPNEVLISINEDGEIEEERFEDVENVYLYERMRETLIYLTNIDPRAMDQIF
jgi:exportin-1